MAGRFKQRFDYPEPLDDIHALRKLLTTGDYEAFDGYIEALPIRRQQYALLGCSSLPRDVLASYQEQMPGSGVAPMLYVDHLIHAAWDVRGSMRARETEQERLHTFHLMMQDITDLGIQAYERRPHPMSVRHMLTLCKTNSRGIDSSLAVFEQAMMLYPGDHTIIDSFINYASNPKWSGIPLEAWRELSEGILATYMPHHPLCMLAKINYHYELVWFHTLHPESLLKEVTAVEMQDTLIPEVIRTMSTCDGERRTVYNWMAHLYYLTGDYDLARHYLEQADGCVLSDPWRGYFDSSRKVRRHLKWWWLNFFNPLMWMS